jgi:hypothetical protein
MDRGEHLEIHHRRLAPLEREPVAIGQRTLDCRDSPGALGMRTGVVVQRRLVPEVERRRDAGTVAVDGPGSTI